MRSGFGWMSVVGFASAELAYSGALNTVMQSPGTEWTADVEREGVAGILPKNPFQLKETLSLLGSIKRLAKVSGGLLLTWAWPHIKAMYV